MAQSSNQLSELRDYIKTLGQTLDTAETLLRDVRNFIQPLHDQIIVDLQVMRSIQQRVANLRRPGSPSNTPITRFPSATSQPLRTATPLPVPTNPPSSGVSLWANKNQVRIGDKLALCYTVPTRAEIEIYVVNPDGSSRLALSDEDDGTGDCIERPVAGPTGIKRAIIKVYVGGKLIGTAETRYQVLD